MPVVTLPSIRSLIRPDPGFVLVDADFDRADAQIVAWEADEPELKKIFQQGIDCHTDNAAFLYQISADRVSKDQRQRAKNTLHGIHYGAKARTSASTANVTVARAEQFMEMWFSRFPGIRRWHTKVEHQLRLSRCVTNAWGFRRFYFDRPDNLLPQALAWLGQSGVAVTINKAMMRVYSELRPDVKIRLQVHDSLLMQARFDRCPTVFENIRRAMQIVVPYADPLIIPVSLKWSRDSWGQMQSWKPGMDWKEAA